jgi:hypothetical protein
VVLGQVLRDDLVVRLGRVAERSLVVGGHRAQRLARTGVVRGWIVLALARLGRQILAADRRLHARRLGLALAGLGLRVRVAIVVHVQRRTRSRHR